MGSDKLYDADVYLIGIGLFELRQITIEALEVLKQARKVFHLTSKHEELSTINSNTYDLGPLYWKKGRAWNIYRKIARNVVSNAVTARPVVFATEGNPMFFNDISWEIAKLGRDKGLKVQALPGISCVDILPIQRGFDMGDLGTQIFEATQLVMFELAMNIFMSSLILQIAEFSISTILLPTRRPVATFAPLVSHLCKFYPREHPALFLRSTSAPNESTSLVSSTVGSIGEDAYKIETGMTLYIPRVKVPTVKWKFTERRRRSNSTFGSIQGGASHD